MLSKKWARSETVIFALLITAAAVWLSAAAGAAQPLRRDSSQASPSVAVRSWASQAREHRLRPRTKLHGTLVIDERGVDFRGTNGRDQRWVFEDIHTAFIAPHRLELETYENRSWHRPGEQRYSFDLTQALPPAVAAAFAARIAQPVQNADPDPSSSVIAAIPVRHRTLTRGTNGVLRFRSDGIDYVTSSKQDSRSWRWSDLQTLSDPDPYHLFIFGYRDTYTFDLKAPLSRALFNRATDEIYAHNGSIPVYAPGTTLRPYSQDAEMREK